MSYILFDSCCCKKYYQKHSRQPLKASQVLVFLQAFLSFRTTDDDCGRGESKILNLESVMRIHEDIPGGLTTSELVTDLGANKRN